MGSKTNRVVLTTDRLTRMGPDTTLWDQNVIGFCARRQAGDAVTFFVKYRTKGGRNGRGRWYRIGRFGSPWQPADARVEAKRILGEVAAGNDPQANRVAKRNEVTVLDVLNYYIDVTAKAKRLKPKTVEQYILMRDAVIGPRLGRIGASELTRADVERLHKEELGDRPYWANRCLMFLSAAYNKAAPALGIMAMPTRGILRHEEKARTVRLSKRQIAKLGEVMRDPSVIEREGVVVLAAIVFLLITARRKHEALKLKHVDLAEDDDTGTVLMALHDHKTSRKRGTIYYAMSEEAVTLIERLPRIEGNPFVFASAIEDDGFVKINDAWKRLCADAGIQGVRIHDLRRTAGDHSADLNVELDRTAKLLGHADTKTTAKHYVLADARRMKGTVDQVSDSLTAILNGPKAA